MDRAVLINALRNDDNQKSEIAEYYRTASSASFYDSTEEFEECLKSLKELIEKQYDFTWIIENAKKFNVSSENFQPATRREFSQLCDDVCILLGNRIEECCKYNLELIITKPSKFEDSCPYPSEELVIYGFMPSSVNYDGHKYLVGEPRYEKSSYYTVKVAPLERI